MEGVVIVGSILLAFGIQAWWEGVQERSLEQDYLHALQADFDATDSLFARTVQSYESIAKHNRDFLRLLDGPPGSVSVDSLESLVRTAFITNEFTPVMATYDDMVNSGALSLLQSDSLRFAIARFQASLKWVQVVSDYTNNHWDQEIGPYLTAHFNLTKVFAAEADLGTIVLAGTDLGGPVTRIASDESAFWGREFMNLLAMKTTNQIDAVRFAKASLLILEEVLRLLEVLTED